MGAMDQLRLRFPGEDLSLRGKRVKAPELGLDYLCGVESLDSF